jgi:hypothetical protein
MTTRCHFLFLFSLQHSKRVNGSKEEQAASQTSPKVPQNGEEDVFKQTNIAQVQNLARRKKTWILINLQDKCKKIGRKEN